MTDTDRLWREAALAHFDLAKELASTALDLEQICTHLDDEGDWFYGELAHILPAAEQVGELPRSDLDFFLERATSHREVAKQCALNGILLLEVISSGAREETGYPESWQRRDEVTKAMEPYEGSLTRASAAAEKALHALDVSASAAGETGPAETMAAIVRFLNEEAALISAFRESNGT